MHMHLLHRDCDRDRDGGPCAERNNLIRSYGDAVHFRDSAVHHDHDHHHDHHAEAQTAAAESSHR